MSPTARSMKLLRDMGYEIGVVERFNAYSKKRSDLFGFIDMVAMRPGEILGVQTTSDAHVADHVDKVLAEPRALRWLEAGGQIVVHGWAKKGPRGKRKKWTCRAIQIIQEDFQ